MKSFMIGTTALVLGLAVVATAEAGKNGGSGGGSGGRSMGGNNHNGNGNGNGHSNFKPSQFKTQGNQFKTAKNSQFKTAKNSQFKTTKNNKTFTAKHLNPSYKGKDYNKKFGFQKNGYNYYKGKNHGHWNYRCWWPSGGCYTNYCPSTCCYYYYCQPDNCWYPIDYAPYGTYSWGDDDDDDDDDE